jgi:hypothetical protein
MKSLGKFTFRGVVVPIANSGTYGDNGDLQRILLFDGDFGTAFKITYFAAWAKVNSTSGDCSAVISTDRDGLEDETIGSMNVDNNMQIGWATSNFSGASARESSLQIVDRDNLIVQDLWIAAYNASSTDKGVNYYIEAEKFDVGLSIGSYSMVRNASQDFPN